MGEYIDDRVDEGNIEALTVSNYVWPKTVLNDRVNIEMLLDTITVPDDKANVVMFNTTKTEGKIQIRGGKHKGPRVIMPKKNLILMKGL